MPRIQSGSSASRLAKTPLAATHDVKGSAVASFGPSPSAQPFQATKVSSQQCASTLAVLASPTPHQLAHIPRRPWNNRYRSESTVLLQGDCDLCVPKPCSHGPRKGCQRWPILDPPFQPPVSRLRKTQASSDHPLHDFIFMCYWGMQGENGKLIHELFTGYSQ